jgi:hypothetical protein
MWVCSALDIFLNWFNPVFAYKVVYTSRANFSSSTININEALVAAGSIAADTWATGPIAKARTIPVATNFFLIFTPNNDVR